MEDDVKKDQKVVETRLLRLEGEVANIAVDVGEVVSNVEDIRTRMDDVSRAMRQEMRDGDRALRGAWDERFRAAYKEMLDRDLALREEMYEGLRSVRQQLSDKELSDTKIWALLIAVVVLGAAAHGFHWI